MPIFFCNSDPIDLLAIEIMGLSAKPGNASPIGFFGTGLKFAIATLLRTGHTVAIARQPAVGPRDTITFHSETRKMRGQEFEQIIMESTSGPAKALGFTTELGKLWEPWMAFRELHSNVLDEGGETLAAPAVGTLREKWGTVIEVTGQGIEDAWRDRDAIFLPAARQRQAASPNGVEILAGAVSPTAYYRGVRAHTFQSPTIATYNMLNSCRLTEDRTIASGEYYFRYHLQQLVQASHDTELIKKFLLPPEHHFERTLQFDPQYETSDEFLAVVKEEKRNLDLNQSALDVYWDRLGHKESRWEEASLSASQHRDFDEALGLCALLGATLAKSEVRVVKGLGPRVLGLCSHGQIYIALATFDQGPTMLAGTLLEEWLHRDERLQDETREMQNWLFNKVVTLARQLQTAAPVPAKPEPSIVGARFRDPADGNDLATTPRLLSKDELWF